MSDLTKAQAEVLSRAAKGEVIHHVLHVLGNFTASYFFHINDNIHPGTFWALVGKDFLLELDSTPGGGGTYKISRSGRAALKKWREKHA